MILANASAPLTWDIARDVRQLFDFPFMVNALTAGTIVAITAGVIGWFVVLRQQSFPAHTFSVVGFSGAAGAVLLGLSASVGYFAFCVMAALLIAILPVERGRGYVEESAAVGTIQAFALACGFLFVSLYGGFLNGITSLLFGSFLGITTDQVMTLAALAVCSLIALAVIGRPLLFASIDPDVAAARGVQVRILGGIFLVILGIAVAETSQITGSLLAFSLIIAPPAAARALTIRPIRGLVYSVLLAVGITWAGLAISYYSTYPVGFWITTIAFTVYLFANVKSWKTIWPRVRALA